MPSISRQLRGENRRARPVGIGLDLEGITALQLVHRCRQGEFVEGQRVAPSQLRLQARRTASAEQSHLQRLSLSTVLQVTSDGADSYVPQPPGGRGHCCAPPYIGNGGGKPGQQASVQTVATHPRSPCGPRIRPCPESPALARSGLSRTTHLASRCRTLARGMRRHRLLAGRHALSPRSSDWRRRVGWTSLVLR